MNWRIASHSLLAIAMCACAGGDDDGGGMGGGGKADDTGQTGSAPAAIDSLAFRAQPAADISDPGCMNCDAVGIGSARLETVADVEADVLVKVVVRHANPDDVRMYLSLNSNNDYFEPEEDGFWMQGLGEGDHSTDSALQISVIEAPDADGCETNEQHPTCFEITATGALGRLAMRATPHGDSGATSWDLKVLDLGLNGARGQIRELSIVLIEPAQEEAN